MDITEKAFETHIVNHLCQVHRYRLRISKQKNDARDSHYQKFLCLNWEILLEFITATQPDTWKALEKQHGTATVGDKFLQRLTREIERRVLDRQLQNTVRQFEQTPGVVVVIDKHSDQLVEALTSSANIIVSTLQKFPVIVNKVDQLQGQNFAIIVD